MSQHSSLTGTRNLIRTIAISVAATGLLTWLALGGRTGGFLRFVSGLDMRLHWPNFGLIVRAPLQIQVHVASVTLALIIGGVLLTGVKGNARHRVLGWTWSVAMASAAISSLFIQTIRPGHFSFLHLFAGWTLIALPFAIAQARRHNVRVHGRMMTGLFVGGLVLAGITAFLPGRMMWEMMFG